MIARLMPGKDPSPRGSCWCQAWAAATPGMGTNCICLGKPFSKQQYQGGVQEVWVVAHTSWLSPQLCLAPWEWQRAGGQRGPVSLREVTSPLAPWSPTPI